MVVPVSVETHLRRLEKTVRELKQLEKSPSSEEESIIVADICNSCVLLLDKAMNAIWSALASQNSDRRKPNIYFPICEDRERLTTKLQQYQLPNMEHDCPELFELIESAQAYRGVKWLAALHKLAGIRHEAYPRVAKMDRRGVALGVGQDLYIESFTSDGNGNMNFKGHGINRESGRIEPVRVYLVKEVRSVLEEFDETPFEFCSSSVAKVKRLASDLYRHLHGPKMTT